jgi:hypothetical protein
MSKIIERQKFLRYWQETTGSDEIDLDAVAEMALSMGWVAPPPLTPRERLAKQFKDGMRQDVRHDRKTGRPYRGYHAVPKYSAEGQLVFSYIDIDNPRTKPENFKKACVTRREQSVGDMYQLFLDQTHWNDTRPPEQQVPILPADLGFDIELRLAADDEEPKAA